MNIITLDMFEILAKKALFSDSTYNELDDKNSHKELLDLDSIMLRSKLSQKDIFADTTKIIGL